MAPEWMEPIWITVEASCLLTRHKSLLRLLAEVLGQAMMLEERLAGKVLSTKGML